MLTVKDGLKLCPECNGAGVMLGREADVRTRVLITNFQRSN